MQKVAWPTTIAKNPKGKPTCANVVDSAMPVTMPGRAIGSTTTNEIDSRPKKRWRATAMDARVPSISAMMVALTAAAMDVMNACCRPV